MEPLAAGPHGTARCRAAWNREHTGDLTAGASALVWSITALSDTIERLTRMRAWDKPRAFAVIGEAVWWVTIVDATLVRHHPDAYDTVMTGQAPAQRQLVEATLAGLRFVRNRIGDEADLAEFIEPGDAGPGAGQRRITGWIWKPLPEPALGSLSPRGQAWEMTVPGLPGSAGGPHHRGELRPGRRIPQAGRRERTGRHGRQLPGPTLKALSLSRRKLPYRTVGILRTSEPGRRGDSPG
jgi:hypothetical protein